MPSTTVLVLTGIVLFFMKKPLFSLLMGLLCVFVMGLLVATSKRDRVRRAYAQLLLHRIRRHQSLTLKQWRAFNRLVRDGIITQKEAPAHTFVSVPELKNLMYGKWIPPTVLVR
jgi:hypothetical protein